MGTWNNFVGGVFMIMFGVAIIWMAFKEAGVDPNSENAGFFQLYFKFLDNLAGRGAFFIFVGMRVVPLGKFYCLIANLHLHLRLHQHRYAFRREEQGCRWRVLVQSAAWLILLLSIGRASVASRSGLLLPEATIYLSRSPQ